MKKVILMMLCMTIMQVMIGQTYWTPEAGIQNNMTMSAVLYVNGEEQHLDNIEIGAFCGDSCRAAALPYTLGTQKVYILTIVGNTNEVITFRLYDHQLQEELDYVCDQTYTFEIDAMLGSWPNWYQLPFTAPTTVEQSLAQGWNWWAPMVQASVADIEAALGDTLLQVKPQDDPLGENLAMGEMYRIQTSAPCNLTLTGIRLSSATVSITNGNNWFGYTGTAPAAIATVFGSTFGPATGDKIIAQDEGFAIYDGTAWNGTLTQLQPGHGYVYFSTASGTKTVVFE